jgi:hypothetical protein
MPDDRLFFGDLLLEGDPPLEGPPHVTFHPDMVQGSDEWLAARRGLITASEVKLLLTPTLKIADNDKTRAHLYELAAQRITGHVEPHYVSDDMLRGQDEEYFAREYYASRIAPVRECGFITSDRFGFTLGYSPDGLVGTDGLIECKSRKQSLQVKTIVEHVVRDGGSCPDDYVLQCQTGLLVTERKWLDLCVYSNGMHMAVIRILPDPAVQDAIIAACAAAEERIATIVEMHATATENPDAYRLIKTERRVMQEMHL